MMKDPKAKPDIFLGISVMFCCFASAALCPFVSFFGWSYLNIADYLSLDWATRIQFYGFWLYEVVVILVSVFMLRRGASKLQRQGAWSALIGALLGIGLGMWIIKTALQGIAVIGP